MASPDDAELERTGLSLTLCETLNGEYNVKYRDRMTKKSLELLFPMMTLPDSMVLMYGKLSPCTLPVLGPAVLMLGSTDRQNHEGTLVSKIMLQVCFFQLGECDDSPRFHWVNHHFRHEHGDPGIVILKHASFHSGILGPSRKVSRFCRSGLIFFCRQHQSQDNLPVRFRPSRGGV